MKHGKSEYFDVIATELCRRVELPYPPPEGTKYDVDAATWTEVEDNDFRKWMKAYLKTVPLFKSRGARYIDKEIEWFVFQYGWKWIDKIPPPGSDKAIKKGCCCAVEDNHYGEGCGWTGENGEPLFWVTADCPLHGVKSDG